MKSDFLIIGGGIVGLSAGWALLSRFPGKRVIILEKEAVTAAHQTGRNSGVIHSGIYYKPGSFKASFSQRGRRSLVAFCQQYDIAHEICGKLIVATKESELPLLDNLYERGLKNGLAVKKLTSAEAHEIEPNVVCVAAIRVPETGITDYKLVSRKLGDLIVKAGGKVHFETKAQQIQAIVTGTDKEFTVTTPKAVFRTKFLINCAGLQSDRIAKLAGLTPAAKIVPFRGEYYELTQSKRQLVRHLVYPVPNPEFPFLGVHFTRMVDGSVHAGPNAVLALAREGYSWRILNPGDLFETIMYPGFVKLAAKYLKEGLGEVVRSLSKERFTNSLKQLVPAIGPDDLLQSQAGIRAQALGRDGKLIDDFLIIDTENSIHVLNAPSPAATCSLEIGQHIANLIKQ